MIVYDKISYGSVEVYYTRDLDGGGSTFGQDYLDCLHERVGKVDCLFEWCAGPGFIGFSLLASGVCNTLCLADVNPKAVEACRETIKRNGLEQQVRVYLSDCLESIPQNEVWDLVVGNPPHSGSGELRPHWGSPDLYMDNQWAIHRKFYSKIYGFMKANGNIIIQENAELSTAETFHAMIEDGGLTLVGSYPCRTEPNFYYVWAVKRSVH